MKACMKHLLIFVTLLALGLRTEAQDTDIVTLGTKASWPPYHIDTGKGTDGLAVRALACVMARLNQPYVIRKLPWSRAQLMTQRGELDGFFAASKNAHRDKFAVLSMPFLPQTRRLYMLRQSGLMPAGGLTLEFARNNLRIAARHSSNALKTAQDKGLHVTLTPQSAPELLSLLVAGRVDAIVENELVFERELAAQNIGVEDTADLILGEKNMGVYFGKAFLEKHPGFMDQFNANVAPCSLLPGE